jgi:hypothetical protein
VRREGLAFLKREGVIFNKDVEELRELTLIFEERVLQKTVRTKSLRRVYLK